MWLQKQYSNNSNVSEIILLTFNKVVSLIKLKIFRFSYLEQNCIKKERFSD